MQTTHSDGSTSHAIAPEPAQRSLQLRSTPVDRLTFWSVRRKGERFEAKVTRQWFRFYWVLFMTIYVVDGCYLVGVSCLYYWMLYQPVVVETIQEALHLLPIPTLRAIVWVFPVLAAGHLLTAGEVLVYSFQRGRLTLVHPQASQPAKKDPGAVGGGGARRLVGVLIKRMQLFLLQRVYPFVTLEGKHFDIWFAMQEVFQIVSQTYQCYSMSRLVTTKWMNQLAVLCTFLNCVSSPVIRWVVPPQEIPRQRFFCVLIDCCLGFVQSVVLPFIIFWPYSLVYDTGDYYFPEQLAYDCVWYVEMIHNLDQIFLVSYFDFLTTALPHLNFLRSLRGISHMLRSYDMLEPDPVVDRTTVVPVATSRQTISEKRSLSASTPTALKQPNAASTSTSTCKRQKKHGISPSSLYHAICVVHGILLVIIHFAARNNDPLARMNCLSHPNPWFTNPFACSLINVDCYQSAIRGTSSEVTRILQRFDAPSASAMMFSHCPELEMPAMIVAFPQLIGVDVYNSTLVRWTSEAALDADVHPIFSYLNFELSNLPGIPEGILGANLPPTLTDLEFFRTNVSALPDEMGQRWFGLSTLYVEFSELTELPASLAVVPLWYFSVVGNHIERIDDAMFENDTFSQFLLSNNPLQRFPASIGDMTDTCELSFENTNVQEVPEYVIDWALDRVDQELYIAHSVHGTPFCADWDQEKATPSSSKVARYKQTFCSQDLNTSKGYFPIEIIDARRAIKVV